MIQLTARFHALGEAASQQTQQTQQEDPSWEDCLCSPACRAYSSQSPARPGQAWDPSLPKKSDKGPATDVGHYAAPVLEPFVNCLHESQNLSKPDQEIMPLGNN